MLLVDRGAVDDVVSVREFVQQLWQFFRWMLQVIVHSDDHVALRFADTAEHGIVLAVISAHLVPAYSPVQGSESLDHPPRIVAAAVFDEQNLEVDPLLLEDGAEAFMEPLKAFGCTVDRDYDGYLMHRIGNRQSRSLRFCSSVASVQPPLPICRPWSLDPGNPMERVQGRLSRDAGKGLQGYLGWVIA